MKNYLKLDSFPQYLQFNKGEFLNFLINDYFISGYYRVFWYFFGLEQGLIITLDQEDKMIVEEENP